MAPGKRERAEGFRGQERFLGSFILFFTHVCLTPRGTKLPWFPPMVVRDQGSLTRLGLTGCG